MHNLSCVADFTTTNSGMKVILKIIEGFFNSWFVTGVSLAKNVEEFFTDLPLVSGTSVIFS